MKRVARQHALRAVSEQQVCPDPEPRGLEDRRRDVAARERRDRRFDHDQVPRCEHRDDRVQGRREGAQVRDLHSWIRGRRNGDEERVGGLRNRRDLEIRADVRGVQQRLNVGLVDLERSAADGRDLLHVRVHDEHRMPGAGEQQGERQADVASPNDRDAVSRCHRCPSARRSCDRSPRQGRWWSRGRDLRAPGLRRSSCRACCGPRTEGI